MRPDPDVVLLMAPFDGWCTSLDEAPDTAFAERMLGDGLAIDPTSATVQAPCDGVVTALPASRHAVTLRATGDAEVLIHVGIDTVGLHGAGFEALTSVGARVRTGDPLLRLDLDGLAQRAKSLLTPIVLLGDTHRLEKLVTAAPVTAGQAIARLTRRAAHGGDAAAAPVDRAAPIAIERTARVMLAHGLHARPAARIARLARGASAPVRLRHGNRDADARSVTALMQLGVAAGDDVTLRTTDRNAAGVLDAMVAVLATVEESATAVNANPGSSGLPPQADTPVALEHGTTPAAVRGVIASRGLALGPAHHLRAASFDVPVEGHGAAREAAKLRDALDTVRTRLGQHARSGDRIGRELAAAHELLLDDPALVDVAHEGIERGHSAGHAWRVATAKQVRALEGLGDAYLRERAADLRDLEAQVLTALGLTRAPAHGADLPPGAVVLATDLLPSQFAALDSTRIAGLCTAGGGPTSHVAILANSVGLPMLVATGPAIEQVPDGGIVLLDALSGHLHPAPDAALRAQATERIAALRVRRDRERALARRECRMADGTRVRVYANLGAPQDATRAIESGAEGCGLLRSEFLFLDRQTAPGEDEQLAVYQETARRLEGRPLTIRTLDVGGDKPLAYLPMPDEENPALGMRGIRTSLHRPELLREQLRAILRVEPADQCRILLPMVTEAGEITTVRAELAASAADVGRERPVSLGAMIETPAAAVLAESLARHVEFFSIGTNDLTQYTLAMDRTHPELAARLDGLHPAVLRMMSRVCEAAHLHGRDVAVCGSLAMDEAAIPILLGLGVHELSVVPAAIPAVKALVSTLEFEVCRALAQRALACESAAAVRRLAVPASAVSQPIEDSGATQA